MNKTKAAGFGIVAVIVALAAIGLSKLFDRGGGFGIGVTGSPALTSSTSKGESGAEMGTLVITVDGDQYIVDGRPRSLDDVVSAAKARAKNPSDQSGSQILVKKNHLM